MEMAIWSLLGTAPGDDAGVGKLRRGLGDRRRQAAEARCRNPHRRLWRDLPTSAASIRPATSSSPGTGRPAACACPTPTGSPPTAPACRSATRPRPPSRRTSTGRRSMSAPSAGRRRSAAKPRTACWCCRPRAVERLEREPAPRPLPKIFRLTKGGKLIDGIFKGETINTPSMLCVEDWLFALDWAERIGGLEALIARADANAAALDRWVQSGRLDRASRARSGDPLEHVGLPAVRRPLRRRRQQGAAEGDGQAARRRKARPTTSAPIATRRRACASGAARRSTPPTSRRSGRGSTGRGRRPR